MLPEELRLLELLLLTVPLLLLLLELLRFTVPLLLLEVDRLRFTVPLLLLLPELLLFTVPRFELLLLVDLLRTVEEVPRVRFTVPLDDSTCRVRLLDLTSERVRAALFRTDASDLVALFTALLLVRLESALDLGP